MGALGLYLMSEKGLAVLNALLSECEPGTVAYVVTAQDLAVQADFAAEISAVALGAGVPCVDRSVAFAPAAAARTLLAVSWRWLLSPSDDQQLVVLHDSVLPRYRGFAPLVNSLVNGERYLGVTALLARSGEPYDSGPILAQRQIEAVYPLKISDAISRIAVAYAEVAVEVARQANSGPLLGEQQNEAQATYSPWLDELDYLIDWSWPAAMICRFVDAVGYPYRGAATFLGQELIRVVECEEHRPQLRLERSAVGKVLMVNSGLPVVACGDGAVTLRAAHDDRTKANVLPLGRLRVRFGRYPSSAGVV